MTLSVIVGLTSGSRDVLRCCLQFLLKQSAPLHEILVPYDSAVAGVATLRDEFPSVRFVAANVAGADAARAGGASREHHDVLRTVGLRAATGSVLLLIEDYAQAAPGWAGALASALATHPDAGAAGGPIACSSSASILGWALWFCDFGRYQPPLPEGTAATLSDTNVAYPAQALAQVAPTWAIVYREPAVHAALLATGLRLYTAPDALVHQARPPIALGAALRERFVWGRSYGGTRPGLTRVARLARAAAAPVLPALLTWRVMATAVRRGGHLGRALGCAPYIVLLQGAWATGEALGYLTNRPDGRRAPASP